VKFAQVNASIDRQYDSMATANSLHLAKESAAAKAAGAISTRRDTSAGSKK